MSQWPNEKPDWVVRTVLWAVAAVLASIAVGIYLVLVRIWWAVFTGTFVVLMAIGSVGCEKVISQERLPSIVEPRMVSCQTTGFCYTCGIGFDGNYDCGMKFSTSCDGKRSADVKVTPIRITYEGGSVVIREETIVQRFTSSCQQ